MRRGDPLPDKGAAGARPREESRGSAAPTGAPVPPWCRRLQRARLADEDAPGHHCLSLAEEVAEWYRSPEPFDIPNEFTYPPRSLMGGPGAGRAMRPVSPCCLYRRGWFSAAAQRALPAIRQRRDGRKIAPWYRCRDDRLHQKAANSSASIQISVWNSGERRPKFVANEILANLRLASTPKCKK